MFKLIILFICHIFPCIFPLQKLAFSPPPGGKFPFTISDFFSQIFAVNDMYWWNVDNVLNISLWVLSVMIWSVLLVQEITTRYHCLLPPITSLPLPVINIHQHDAYAWATGSALTFNVLVVHWISWWGPSYHIARGFTRSGLFTGFCIWDWKMEAVFNRDGFPLPTRGKIRMVEPRISLFSFIGLYWQIPWKLQAWAPSRVSHCFIPSRSSLWLQKTWCPDRHQGICNHTDSK